MKAYLQELYNSLNIVDSFDKVYMAAITINTAYDMGYDPDDDSIFESISSGLESYKVHILYEWLIYIGEIDIGFLNKIGLSEDELLAQVCSLICSKGIDNATPITVPKVKKHKQKEETLLDKMGKQWEARQVRKR